MSAFFTDEQQSIRDLARDFAQTTVAPVVKTLETGCLDTLKTLWQAMGEVGLTALPFPEAYGGVDVDAVAYVLALEEIAKVSASLATALSVHTGLGSMPIVKAATPEQKEKYLPGIASGQSIVAFALTEPNAGSDAAAGTMTARLEGDSYVLNGAKIFITNALLADLFLVTARTNPASTGVESITAFVVERDRPGLTITKGDEKMGLNGGDWGELHFNDCRIPTGQRIGEEGQGFKLFMQCLDSGRVSIGAISLGLAQASLDASITFAKQREQFGKPIAQFQAIQFKLADMATRIEAARRLVYNAAVLKQAGAVYTQEASFAKLFASETANFCAKEAVQIHGGYGYTKDFPVERYFRDAKVMEIFEGTSQIQRIVIGRQLLKA